MSGNVKVAIVGLGFGAEFIPIYQAHPNAEIYAVCQRKEESLNKIGDQFGVAKRYTKFEDVLADPEVRLCPYQQPDSRSRLDVDGGVEGRETRYVYRANGDHRRRMSTDLRAS